MGLTVGQRIIAGFLLIIVMTLGLGWYQLSNVRAIAERSASIADDDVEKLRLIRQVSNARSRALLSYLNAWSAYFFKKAGIPAKDPTVYQNEWNVAVDQERALTSELESAADQRARETDSETHRQLLEELRDTTKARRQNLEQTVATINALFDLMGRDDLARAAAQGDVLERLRGESAPLGNKLEELAAQIAANSKQRILELEANLRAASLVVLGIVLVAGLVIAILIYRSVSGPLADFMRFVGRVGAGDLTRTLELRSGDEIGRLANHLNEMVASLKDIATQTRTATENLNSAAAEMQASVQQHATGANEQNAAIQQITSTLTEITRSGSQISDRAKAVAASAEAAAAASKSGLHAVNETTRAMDTIREQAEKIAGNVVSLTEKTQSIGAIITTVNDLSERSSLLALNAAIEAAAAGEHGKSFAVVADEMKNLANQAKEATIEVRSILGDIQHGIAAAVMQTEEAVKRVEAGRQQSATTEQTITNLTRSIEQSVATFEQIVAATNQQQVGIEQVAQSVHGIREASEQMATGSKDVGRAATGLAALSSQLQRLTQRYQV